MKKIIQKAGILFVVFILACIFFYIRTDEYTFSETSDSITSPKASLPLISFGVNGNEINLTRGYSIKRDGHFNRNHITPISTSGEFQIFINEMGQSVKKLDAAVLVTPDMTEYDNVSIQVFEEDETKRKIANIKLSKELTPRQEYMLRVTLTNSDGNSIYYYTRLMVANFGNLTESIAFVNKFHATTFDKNTVDTLNDYMEVDEDLVISDYSHIDIKANLESLSYGELEPTELYKSVPSISEYNPTYVSAYLDFVLSAYTTNGLETFNCKEEYRFNYTTKKTYLMNYDRYMNTVFEGNYVTNEGNLKLGISNNPQTRRLYSEDNKQFLFVYGDSLYHMNTKTNEITRVHTFYDKDNLIRNSISEYDYNMLLIDNDGNASFAVYGYISKGAYEGRTGIIYYRYNASDKVIAEQMFIPLDMEFADMNEDLLKVSYTSETDVYYFTMFNSFYSYELDTNVLKELIADMGDNWLYFEKENTLVYNETTELSSNKRVVIRNLATKTETYITAPEGKQINILGTVDNRIVTGLADMNNVALNDDSSIMVPYESVSICEIDGTEVKKVEGSKGQYICEVGLEKGIISYELYKRISERTDDSYAVYEYVKKDVLINLTKEESETKNYNSKLLEKTKTEYYMTMPISYKPSKEPKLKETSFKVITKETQAIVSPRIEEHFYAYGYGQIVDSGENLGPVLNAARSVNGAVIAPDGTIIWQKGITKDDRELKITPAYARECGGYREAIIKMICTYKGITPKEEFNPGKISFYDYLKTSISTNAVCLSDVNLDNLTYFIADGNPIIASYKDYYVLIHSYNKTYVAFYDPVSRQKTKLTKDEAEKAINQAGGVYYIFY